MILRVVGGYLRYNLATNKLQASNDGATFADIVAPPIRARVYKDANQSIPNTTTTGLSFNAETFDTDSMHDNTTNNDRLTINTAGVYLLKAQVAFAASGTGYRQAFFLKNGASKFAYTRPAPSPSDRTTVQIAAVVELVAGDYVSVSVNHASGGALNVEGAASDQYVPTHFEAVRLGSTS